MNNPNRGEFCYGEWEPNRCPLQCSRQHDIRPGADGFAEGDITITGKTKPYTYRAVNPGLETTRVSREFVCSLCGHTGWSTHQYLESAELPEDLEYFKEIRSRALLDAAIITQEDNDW